MATWEVPARSGRTTGTATYINNTFPSPFLVGPFESKHSLRMQQNISDPVPNMSSKGVWTFEEWYILLFPAGSIWVTKTNPQTNGKTLKPKTTSTTLSPYRLMRWGGWSLLLRHWPVCWVAMWAPNLQKVYPCVWYLKVALTSVNRVWQLKVMKNISIRVSHLQINFKIDIDVDMYIYICIYIYNMYIYICIHTHTLNQNVVPFCDESWLAW